MDLAFQVPLQYCFSQHWTLLSPSDTTTTVGCSCFGPASSFFLELLVTALCSSPVAYWTPSNLRDSSSSVIFFILSYCSWGSHRKNTGVVCHSIFQWAMFCQNSSLWPIHLGWPCTVWLIASLSYTNPFATRLWPMNGQFIYRCHFFFFTLLWITTFIFSHVCSKNYKVSISKPRGNNMLKFKKTDI